MANFKVDQELRKVYAAYYEKMFVAYRGMTEAEHEELRAWEEANLHGGVGTSDWPGWQARIGLPPWKVKQ